jgi:hypothetical protein
MAVAADEEECSGGRGGGAAKTAVAEADNEVDNEGRRGAMAGSAADEAAEEEEMGAGARGNMARTPASRRNDSGGHEATADNLRSETPHNVFDRSNPGSNGAPSTLAATGLRRQGTDMASPLTKTAANHSGRPVWRPDLSISGLPAATARTDFNATITISIRWREYIVCVLYSDACQF